MKLLLILIFSSAILWAEFELSGHIDLDSQAYLTKPDEKHKNSFTLKQTLEFRYEKDALSAFGVLYAQEDYYDFLASNEHDDRTFARLDEAYLRYDFEDDSIQAGKSIKFWGALELRNIVDAFNPKELRNDIFSKTDKLGVWNTSYSHYTDNGELSIIVKLNEPDQKMAAHPYVYYIFPEIINYDSNLEASHGEFRGSLYLMYNGSTDSQYSLDFSFIYENGYDSQRYFSRMIDIPTSYIQNAYLVNKLMTYNTLALGSTLLKLEALYVDVYEDTMVGDYSHIGVGFEHTMENFYESSSLGLIGEYYNYTTYESDKYDDLELFETMQNDFFLGLRYSFNDEDDSSIICGIVADFEYNEEVYYIKYESRFADNFKVNLDYYFVEASKDFMTAYAFLGQHQRVALNLAYHF